MSRHFSANMSGCETHNQIVIVNEHTPILSRLALHPHNQPGSNQFSDNLHDRFPFHTNLSGNVIIAVPTVMQDCAEGLAEKEIHKHLPRCEHTEYAAFYHEIPFINLLQFDCIAVCPALSIRFFAALQMLNQPLLPEPVDCSGDSNRGFDAAMCSDCALPHCNDSVASQCVCTRWKTAQIRIYSDFLCVQSE